VFHRRLFRPPAWSGRNRFWPTGQPELYVRVGDTVHPALNLASARLIAGTDANPTMVPISEIKKLPMGPLVGIPGAPDDLVVATPTDAGRAV
jgi:hypothetical protein